MNYDRNWHIRNATVLTQSGVTDCLARWKAGRDLNENFGMPTSDDELQTFHKYPVPGEVMEDLCEIYDRSKAVIGDFRRFHLRFQTIESAQAAIEKHRDWYHIYHIALRDRTEEELRNIDLGKAVQSAERLAHQIMIAVPDEFRQAMRNQGKYDFEIREMAKQGLIYLATHAWAE